MSLTRCGIPLLSRHPGIKNSTPTPNDHHKRRPPPPAVAYRLGRNDPTYLALREQVRREEPLCWLCGVPFTFGMTWLRTSPVSRAGPFARDFCPSTLRTPLCVDHNP